MELYLVSFNTPNPPKLAQRISHVVDNLCNLRVYTRITLQTGDRSRVADYDTKIAFCTPPKTNRVYGLKEVPVYIDDRYTTLYFSHPHNMYAIFLKDLTDNVWNVVRPLMPTPEVFYNPAVTTSLTASGLARQVYVDTARKRAVFDKKELDSISS